jgi:peptidyl-prolyl cis-trans isomerase C
MHYAKNMTMPMSVVALVGLLLIAGCGARGDSAAEQVAQQQGAYQLGQPLSDSTYAVVVESEYGADTLTTRDFRAQLGMIFMQFPAVQANPEQSREVRRSIVEDFVMRHLLFGEAARTGVAADPDRVEMQMSQIRSQFPNEEAYRDALATEDLTEDSLRVTLEEMVRQQMVQEQMAENVPDPTEQDLETYRSRQAEEIRAQHILFLTQNMGPQERDEVRRKAQAVLDSVRTGADFEAMARRHSDDGSAERGGDLNYFTRGQMVEPFEDAAFALADSGDVTPQLVETRYGFHIIRLTDRRTGELMDTDQAREMLLRERRREAVESGLDALRGRATVRIHPAIVDADLNESYGE